MQIESVCGLVRIAAGIVLQASPLVNVREGFCGKLLDSAGAYSSSGQDQIWDLSEHPFWLACCQLTYSPCWCA